MSISKAQLVQTERCRYGVLSFFKNDTIVSRSLQEYGEWAQSEIDFISCLLDPGKVVIDVGAYVGTHTLAFAANVGQNGRVYAFEPQPVYFDLLSQNIKQNALSNVTALFLGLSDEVATRKWCEPNLEEAGNFGGVGFSDTPKATSGDVVQQTIRLSRLDELDLGCCHLLKVDVEGMEVNVLRGAQGMLHEHRPIVLAECNSLEHGWPVVEFSNGEGYAAFLLSLPAYNPDNFRHSKSNFFGDSREAALLLLPEDAISSVRERLRRRHCPIPLIPIVTMDDLALGMLAKPQYKYEVLQNTRAAGMLGSNFWANEPELVQMRETIQRQKADLLDVRAELNKTVADLITVRTERDQQEKVLNQQESVLALRAVELATARDEAQKLADTLRQIYGSRGWKALTAYYGIRDALLKGRRLLRPSAPGSQEDASRIAGTIRFLRDMRLLAGSELFDREWYLQQNPDVASLGVNPIRHYLRRGAYEGRDPNRFFDSDWYLQANPDVARAGKNPLVHYLRRGAQEGRNPNPSFDSANYLEQNPSVRQAGLNPLLHFIRSRPQVVEVSSRVGSTLTGEQAQEATGHEARAVMPKTSPRLGERRMSTDSVLSETESQAWRDYLPVATQLAAIRQKRLQRFRPTPPMMISLSEKELLETARSLAFPATEEPLVSIIIPVYENARLTLECLLSIQRSSNTVPYEVILVDDHSSDHSRKILSSIKNVHYLRNETNLGYIRSCNHGADSARGRYLLFLNNDAQATQGWLEGLVKTIQADRVGAVVPKMIFPDGRLQEAGALVNLDGSSSMIGCFDDPELPRFNYSREVMYGSGACLLVDAGLFKELGGFDLSFLPAYCEDCDLGFRIRRSGRRVVYDPKSVVIHHLSATANNVDRGMKLRLVVRNQQRLSERWQSAIDSLNAVRLIAFYLPQYHPIPENDRWWGKGFTEWTNVAKARPNYVGHYQPRLPADLGFYDLRVDEVAEQQAALAQRYGVDGFCYFYYWFAGKRLLEMPLQRIVTDNRPNFPFCIAWANENWTRRWDGRDREVLIAQQHSDFDDCAVIRDMMPYLRHPYYISVNGKPLLIVYRPGLLPDIRRTTELWRDLCHKEGIGDLYLAFVESFEKVGSATRPEELGFDASIEFPPHGMGTPIGFPGKVVNPDFTGVVYDYRQLVQRYLSLQNPGYVRFRTVMPSWDNTARMQDNPVIFENASPGAFQAWLEAVIEQTHEQNFGDERIVFLNAWNEWGEGNYVEPDRRNGHAYLEAIRNARDSWLKSPQAVGSIESAASAR